MEFNRNVSKRPLEQDGNSNQSSKKSKHKSSQPTRPVRIESSPPMRAPEPVRIEQRSGKQSLY